MEKRKYRVLAADDEFWSRESLKTMLPWAEYGLEFLEPACDGEEVLERMEKERPDIVLTDINMPFLSGLELLDQLQEKWPEVVTIAVSGYDDFDKVKGVFISGGLDYLLKPVGKEDLIRVMTKALGVLAERESRRRKEAHQNLQAYKMSSFLEDSEYSALLTEKLYGGEGAKVRATGTDSFSEMSSALVKFYDNTRIAQKFDYDALQISWNIKTKLRELCSDGEDRIIFHYNGKTNEFLLMGKTDRKHLKEFAEKVLQVFPLKEYGPLSVALHPQAGTLDDIGRIYREMMAALIMRPFLREHDITVCPGAGESAQTALDIFPDREEEENFEKELLHFLETGQNAEASRLVLETSGFAHCGDGSWSYLAVKQYVSRVTNILLSYVKRELPEARTSLEETIDDNMDYFLRCLDAKSLITTMRMLLDGLMKEDDRKTVDSVSGQMEYVRQHIEKHYRENITLASLAEEYHVDASYLSRTFSKKYGESVITYLTRIRLEKAVELMRDPEKKLDTISYLAGYDDYNYFSRIFRKKMGMSPSEYRSKIVLSNSANMS